MTQICFSGFIFYSRFNLKNEFYPNANQVFLSKANVSIKYSNTFGMEKNEREKDRILENIRHLFFPLPPAFFHYAFYVISERTAGEEVMSVRALFCPSVVGSVL